MKNTTLIAIAFIDVDGKAALTPFRKGEVTFRPSVARAADLAIILDNEMLVISAARIVSIKEDRTMRLSTKDVPAVEGFDLSDVVATTPWVRRRPTRILCLEFSAKGVLQSVSVATKEAIAARAAEKATGTSAIAVEAVEVA